MSANKQRGTRWESAIVAFLIDEGFTYAERRALSGAHDKGDVTGIPGVVIEAKSQNRQSLAEWLDEAEQERDNAKADHGVVWFKRRGFTSPGRGYVLMSGDDYVWLLKSAGYGPGTESAA
jgi:hypothetical protein